MRIRLSAKSVRFQTADALRLARAALGGRIGDRLHSFRFGIAGCDTIARSRRCGLLGGQNFGFRWRNFIVVSQDGHAKGKQRRRGTSTDDGTARGLHSIRLWAHDRLQSSAISDEQSDECDAEE